MSSQAMKTVVAALKANLEGLAIFGVVLVGEYDSQAILGRNQTPAAVISRGPSRNDYLAGAAQYFPYVNVRIYSAVSADEADDLDEAVCDALIDDPTLDGACMSCLPYSSDPPIPWPPNKNTLHVRDRILAVQYWRDS